MNIARRRRQARVIHLFAHRADIAACLKPNRTERMAEPMRRRRG